MQHFDTTPHRYRELFGNDRTGLHCLPLLSRRSNLAAGRKLKLEMWTGTIRFFEYEDAAREVAAKEEATAKQGAAAKEEAAKRDPVREQKYPNLRSLKKTISQVFKPTRTEGHEGHGASE